MADGSVEIALKANADKLIRGFKRAQGGADKFFKALERRRDGLRRASIGLSAAFAGQLFLANKLADAAGVQEQAEADLQAALEQTSGNSEELTKKLVAQAKALQGTTAFGDEAIISAQALLATYGVAADKMEAATQATLDFAAATGRDLNTAALTVGKSVGAGFTAELSRYGIVLDTSTIPKTQVAEAVLKKLNDQFGGRAQKAVDTYAGKKKQLANIVGDLNEAIGRALIPMITSLMTKVQPVVERTIEWVDSNQKLVGVLLGIGIGGTGLLAALSTMGFALSFLPALLLGLSGPVGIVILSFTALAAAMGFIISQQERFPTTTEGQWKALRRVRKEIEMQEKIMKDVSKVWGENSVEVNGHAKKIRALKDEEEKLNEAIRAGILQRKLQHEANKLLNQSTDEGTESMKAFMEQLRERVRIREEAQNLGPDDLLHVPITDEDLGRIERMNELLLITGQRIRGVGLAQSQEAIKLLNDIEEASTEWAFVMTDIFSEVANSGENLVSSFVKSWAAATIRIIRMVIEAEIIKVLAEQVAESAKAAIEAPLTFGASLLALAPIAAAAAGGIAALRQLESKFTEHNLRTGGIARGGETVHPLEVVFNPARQDLGDFQGMLAQVAPSMAAEMGGGDVNVNIGSISSDVDVDRMLQKVANAVRFARTGRV